MNGVTWLFVIAGALVLAVITLYILHVVASRTGRTAAEWLAKRGYARQARRHNANARRLRLEKKDFFGLPLPNERQGTLRITRKQLEDAPGLVQLKQYQRVLKHRFEDLWVDWEQSNDPLTGDVIFRWKPNKKRRPREVY